MSTSKPLLIAATSTPQIIFLWSASGRALAISVPCPSEWITYIIILPLSVCVTVLFTNAGVSDFLITLQLAEDAAHNTVKVLLIVINARNSK